MQLQAGPDINIGQAHWQIVARFIRGTFHLCIICNIPACAQCHGAGKQLQ
jgi:hypothetical protein